MEKEKLIQEIIKIDQSDRRYPDFAANISNTGCDNRGLTERSAFLFYTQA